MTAAKERTSLKFKPVKTTYVVGRCAAPDYNADAERRGPYRTKEEALRVLAELMGVDVSNVRDAYDDDDNGEFFFDEIREAPIADVVSIEALLATDEGSFLIYLTRGKADELSRALGRALREVFDRICNDVYLVDSKGEMIGYGSDRFKDLRWKPRISERIRDEIAAETERIEAEARAKIIASIAAILRKSGLRLPRKRIKWEDLR